MSWSVNCKRQKSSIARCSLQSPSVWMAPYPGKVLGVERFVGAFDGKHLCVIWGSVRDGGGKSGRLCTCFRKARSTMLIISPGGASCCLCHTVNVNGVLYLSARPPRASSQPAQFCRLCNSWSQTSFASGDEEVSSCTKRFSWAMFILFIITVLNPN